MNEEGAALQAAWMSGSASSDDRIRSAVARIVDKDAAQRRERQLRIGGLAAMLSLVPVLLWAAAYGVAPLVRGAYALMAAGCVAIVVVEWLYLDWSRRALPGPDDMRSHLQRTAFMLERQGWLGRTAVLWSSPVFIGVALISVWLFRERTVGGALTVATIDASAWIAAAVLGGRGAAALGRRRQQMEEILADLRQDSRPPSA